MPTVTDIQALSERIQFDSGRIKKLIDDDVQSTTRAAALKAEKYYNSENDVTKLEFNQYKGYYKTGEIGKDGNPIMAYGTKTNENRSNQKISHNFFALIVDQLVNYLTGRGVGYKHDDKNFMKYLDEKLLYDFNEVISEWLTDSRIKGRSYLHVYYDTDGVLSYVCIPSEQIIPIYKDGFKKELQEVIRYYTIPAINEKGESVVRTKVEWWTADKVMYYFKDEEGDYTFEKEMGHWTFSMTTAPEIVENLNWGKVPFVELRTNSKATNDLKDVKLHIDAYDLLMSEFVNQLADIREILIKVLGYSGASANEILEAFRATGVVKIDDATGNVDVIKSEIPIEARTAALKVLKDNIFMLGKGVDTNPEKYGTAIAGVALQMMYRPLDMKADTALLGLKKALGKFMWFLADDYNRNNKGAINPVDIELSFNKNTIEDMSAIIESSTKLKGIASDQTIWERIPGIDPATEAERMAAQSEKELEEYNKAMEKQTIE